MPSAPSSRSASFPPEDAPCGASVAPAAPPLRLRLRRRFFPVPEAASPAAMPESAVRPAPASVGAPRRASRGGSPAASVVPSDFSRYRSCFASFELRSDASFSRTLRWLMPRIGSGAFAVPGVGHSFGSINSSTGTAISRPNSPSGASRRTSTS